MPCSTAFSTSSSSLTSVVSKCVLVPDQKSTRGELKLTVSDLPMPLVHYIQTGVLFDLPPFPIETLLSLLKLGLSQTLSDYPPLAGRLITDYNGHVYVSCNDAGAEFFHVTAKGLFVSDVLVPGYTPDCVKEFYPFDIDRPVSYSTHFKPILAVQVTELADGVFVGCAVCHSVLNGTSFWNFFNSFSELCRGATKINKQPYNFTGDSVLISSSVLKLPEGGPEVMFDVNQPLPERVFSFSREAIQKLKAKTHASVGDESSTDSSWIAEQLSVNVKAHNDTMVRRFVGDWESNPKCFPLGNFDSATITMGSSPRFPMYDNDFGRGLPLAVMSGRANKFDACRTFKPSCAEKCVWAPKFPSAEPAKFLTSFGANTLKFFQPRGAAPSKHVIHPVPDSAGERERSVELDPESLEEISMQPPPSEPIVAPTDSDKKNTKWLDITPSLCFTAAIGIAIKSTDKEFQLPLSFIWLSLGLLLIFSAHFVAKFIGTKFPTAAKVLEQGAVFSAATTFYIAITIPLPPHFQYAAWAFYAATVIIVSPFVLSK